MKALPTIKYAWLQSGFWMSFCLIFNFSSMYLLSKGYSNTQIGLIVAVAGLLSALLQPVIAGLSDSYPRITLRRLILVLSVFIILCTAALLLPGLYFLLHAVFYGIILAVLQILTPLVNAIGMECINRGISINYGLARGVGSVSYALISLVAGMIMERFPVGSAVPLLIILCYVLVFAAAWFFCFQHAGTSYADEDSQENDIKGEKASFFHTYRKFFVLLAGISLIFVCHNMINNYLYQIMTFHHGGSREMGIASCIAATCELPTMIAFAWLIKKCTSGTLLKVSGVFFTIKALLTWLAVSAGGIYLAQSVQLLGFALYVPASVYYTNNLIRKSDRAKGQAFMAATNTVGSVFGSLLGGRLLDILGVPSMLLAATVISAVGMGLVFYASEKY